MVQQRGSLRASPASGVAMMIGLPSSAEGESTDPASGSAASAEEEASLEASSAESSELPPQAVSAAPVTTRA